MNFIFSAVVYIFSFYSNMQTIYPTKWFLRFSRRRSQRSTTKTPCFIKYITISTLVRHSPNWYIFSCTRIGIRSEDLKDFFERSIKGSGLALSSRRLVIPAAIYGLWALSHQYFANDFFDFQVSYLKALFQVWLLTLIVSDRLCKWNVCFNS